MVHEETEVTYEEVRDRHAEEEHEGADQETASYVQAHADRAFLLAEVERSAALLTALEAEAAGLRAQLALQRSERVDKMFALAERAVAQILDQYKGRTPILEVLTPRTWQERAAELGLSARTTGQLEELSPAARDHSLDRIEEGERESQQEKEEERWVARGGFTKDPRRDAWRSLSLESRERLTAWLVDTHMPVPRVETRRALCALLAWESEIDWTFSPAPREA